MLIELFVSREKNLEKLKKLTDDPAFICSILKNKGIEKMPEEKICFKLGLVRNNTETNKN